ncbi:9523_t:CDS:2 [Paraglomus occultum]|uniref:9523_t:CDS:1 n=1 Tax=Paraglomus occultum TaxID=144539 RepID=A0A9N8ZI78_9GLOM|nr:9523_t:CDS:2 [Paraglomus occultum]
MGRRSKKKDIESFELYMLSKVRLPKNLKSAKYSSIYKRERCLQSTYVYADGNHYASNTTHVIPVPVKAVQTKDQCLPNQRLFLKALKQIVSTNSENNVSREKKNTDAAKAFNALRELKFSRDKTNNVEALEFYATVSAECRNQPFYVRLISCMMKDCSNYDRLDLSEAVFAKYVREAMTEEYNSHHHIVVWNTLIKIYVKRGMVKKATKVYEMMPSYKQMPDVVTHKILLNAMSKTKNLDFAFAILEKMLFIKRTLNAASLNTLLQACLATNNEKRADFVFDAIRRLKLGPNGQTFAILLRHCTELVKLDEIWSLIVDAGYQTDHTTQLEFMKVCRRLNFNVSCMNHREGFSKCFDYFLRMREMSSSDDVAVGVYNELIEACGHYGNVQGGMRLIQEMWDNGLEPRPRVYKCILDAVGRSYEITAEQGKANLIERKLFFAILPSIILRSRNEIMPIWLMNTILMAVGRLGDANVMMNLYNMIVCRDLGYRTESASIEGLIAGRLEAVPVDISLANSFINAMSSEQLRSFVLSTFYQLPTSLVPNKNTIKYLFSSIRSANDVQSLFTPYCIAIASRPMDISLNELQETLYDIVQKISSGRTNDNWSDGYVSKGLLKSKAEFSRDTVLKIVTKCISREIIQIQQSTGIDECLHLLDGYNKVGVN